jgi:hypothetical protein
MKAWTEKEFDQMGWHDNHVHAFLIREGQNGSGDLVLDIDYILEWNCPTDQKHYQFLVAPATLTFESMSELKLQLDYATPTAGICPFSIDGIFREHKQYPNGYTLFSWRIPINWPTGEISFIASGYNQVLRADPVWSQEMYLVPQQRASM